MCCLLWTRLGDWTSVAPGRVYITGARAAPWLVYTTATMAALGHRDQICTKTCLHDRSLCCSWTNLDYSSGAAFGCVYCTKQRSELQLDVSRPQEPVVLRDMSTLKGPDLHLDVSTLHRPALHLDMSTPQGPEPHLGVSEQPVLLWTCLHQRVPLQYRGLCCIWMCLITKAWAYLNSSGQQEPLLSRTRLHYRGLSCTWTCLHYRGLSCTCKYLDCRNLCCYLT